MTTKPLRPITYDDLRGQPGISLAAIDSLVEQQPATVMEAIRMHGVGRKTTARLLALGVLSDPEGVQNRTLCIVSRYLTERFGAFLFGYCRPRTTSQLSPSCAVL